MNELKTFLNNEQEGFVSNLQNWKELRASGRLYSEYEFNLHQIWLQDHDASLVNKVLEIVKKEVGKELIPEFDRAYEKVETLLNNLTI